MPDDKSVFSCNQRALEKEITRTTIETGRLPLILSLFRSGTSLPSPIHYPRFPIVRPFDGIGEEHLSLSRSSLSLPLFHSPHFRSFSPPDVPGVSWLFRKNCLKIR